MTVQNRQTHTMKGYNFSKYDPNEQGKSPFEKLLDLFLQLLTYTNGDFNEAMQWMNELDKEYKLTNNEYGIGDFIEDLKDKGYIDEKKETGEIKITSKTEQGIRKKSLATIGFGKLLHKSLQVWVGCDHKSSDRYFYFFALYGKTHTTV